MGLSDAQANRCRDEMDKRLAKDALAVRLDGELRDLGTLIEDDAEIAIVTATDVRPAVKEQVASLGAKFIAVEDEEFKQAETAGGYAKQMSPEYQAKQAELVASHIAKQDIVITTALIPGRPAPTLVTKAMVESMKPGSVIIDMAAGQGGNVAGSKA